MFKLTKHSFLNSIRIWSGSELWQRFFLLFFLRERGSKYHKSGIETPLNDVSLACRWWSNVECWLGSFENFRVSGPVLLRNSIFFVIFQVGVGRSGPPVPSLDPRMGPDYVYTYRTHRLLYDTLRTFYRSTIREREMRVLLNFVIF